MPDFAGQRRTMVDAQLRTNDVTDTRIQHAMGEIPREAFVPPARRAVAYAELCIDVGSGRVLLDPRSFAKMAQAAGIVATDTVLDIGCGSGYSTAVLARLASRIVGLEENAELLAAARANLANVPNVTVVEGPLAAGWPAAAPYDVTFLNGSVDFVPQDIFDQMNDDGRLVCVVRSAAGGEAVVHTKHDGAIGERSVFDADVPALPGFKRLPRFAF